jgi:multiple antibiotic resistance protein
MDTSVILILITTISQIFAILNPISVIPTFLALTHEMDSSKRCKIINQSTITIFLLMILLAIAGSVILDFLKISIYSLQIGGGIILIVIAIDMLGGMPRTKQVENEEEIAIVPIATPLLVGPGTITTIIVLSRTIPLIYLLISIVVVTIITYLLLRGSQLLVKILGINGVRAMGRFMTIIIAAFAAQLLYDGITGWLSSWRFI